jgi:hypothetical protein
MPPPVGTSAETKTTFDVPDESTEAVEASDPLPLAVAILARSAAKAPPSHAGVDPARFMQLLRDLWGGDARAAPSSVSFLRAFPSIFALDIEHRSYGTRGPPASASALNETRFFAIDTVRLTSAAADRAALAAASASSRKTPRIPPGAWPPAAVALLSGFDAALLPRTTQRPSAKVWAPLLERILRERGNRVAVHDVLSAVQAEAFANNLPFPPHAAAWFALSAEPLYARIRPVWSEEITGWRGGDAAEKTVLPKHVRRAAEALAAGRGETRVAATAELKLALSRTKPGAATETKATAAISSRLSSVMAAVELMPRDGPTALDFDAETLRNLAAEAESRGVASKKCV